MSVINSGQQALEQAQEKFRRKVNDPKLYDEILTTKKIDDVWDATFKIQERFARQGRLRFLGKIKPFLERLSGYAKVIEVFMQAKPEVLALIWGPIKIILLWSSQLHEALDKVAETLEEIGHVLPQFTVMACTFDTSDVVKEALALFYEDILDFYDINIHFFRKTHWQKALDVIWSRHRKQVDVVIGNLKKHISLMRNEVTLLEIKEAKEARTRSYEHFTLAEAAHELEKYQSLKSRVSPNVYDDYLDWVRNRCVSDCSTWLFRDENFCEWLDTSKNTIAWLWLQGIPGAGKTYLTAASIDHTRQEHRTLFAFAAHANKKSLSTLSIIQSLIFQAAEDDKSFRTLLVESRERELRGNTSYALDLLKTFLTTTGPVYIIIDGIDEMEECERQILLQRLDDLVKDCGELRLLISSRAEDDISRILENKTTSIRVDDRNSGSIQIYVDHRCQQWMTSRQFNPDTEAELLEFISPLSAKANGMFLYARIILDNLEQMATIEEIRRELRALPNELNDAYHRIFNRINELRPQLRTKCRKILGWIGCAPVPLTALEMEQALSVYSNIEEEGSELPQLITTVGYVQICGPIVEVVNEKLQFVHFTVHEYIFSREIREYIDKAAATEDLTLTFLSYLCSSVVDMDLDDDDIQENILLGRYRLFEYTSFYWPTLIQQTNIDQQHPHHLGRLLDRLLQRGRNYNFTSVKSHLEQLYNNPFLKREYPQAFEMVCETFQYHLHDRRWDWNWGNSHTWADFDPLDTSKMLVRIQEQYEILLLDPTHVAPLQSHYGSRLFRCTFAFCQHSYRGFETKKDRDSHIKNHGKPWKCSFPVCDFSTIGFSSKARRDEHWLKVHLPDRSQLREGNNDFENFDVADAQPILFAFAIGDDTEGARRLLSAPVGKELKAEIIASARTHAAKEGSLAMTRLLAPANEIYTPQAIVTSAIQSEDVSLSEWAISKARPEDCAKIMKVALRTKSEEIYTLWEIYLLSMQRWVPKLSSQQDKDLFQELFSQQLFNDVRNSPLKKARVQRTIRKLGNKMSESLLGSMLVRVARSSCSLPLVKELLALGAPINHGAGRKGTGMTALHIAAKKTTREAAFLMKYLILEGASTYTSLPPKGEIGREIGAMAIFKWVGMTWDELREQRLRIVAGG